MPEIIDPTSNESYVDLRVHFISEILEDGAGGGTSYLMPSSISRVTLFNITDEDLEGMEGALEIGLEEIPEIICYGGSTPLD